jgi:prepilin-type N-terminal cleavage/methylation domain-containing protein
MKTKNGFSMIELVIAIVVIAISVISLPMMVTQANKSDEDAMNQDVFFHCMIIMNDIGSRYWDASIVTQVNSGNGSLIVNALNVDTNTARSLELNLSYPNYRIGHFAREAGDMRKFYEQNLSDPNINASAINASNTDLGATATSMDYIEKYDGAFLDMTKETTPANAGVDAYFKVAIRYVSDKCTTDYTTGKDTCTWDLTGGTSFTSAAQSTNLKRAVVTATRKYGSSQTATVNYSAFFSNVGSVDIRDSNHK